MKERAWRDGDRDRERKTEIERERERGGATNPSEHFLTWGWQSE